MWLWQRVEEVANGRGELLLRMSSSNDDSSEKVDAMRLPWGLAWRLALGQIVAWGILYYAFTVVVGPMQTGTGWSRTFLNSGLSLGLLAWGSVALPVGAWIQRRGGRGLMTTASGLGGGALILMGAIPDRAVYIFAWLMLGVAMSGMLYDSAFAVVTRAFGPQYRRGITLITLVGGLASTVFIPLAQLAVDQLGWRYALVALGCFQIVVGVPLHFFGMPRLVRQASVVPLESIAVRWLAWWAELRRDVTDPRFIGLALWFTAHAAAFTGLIFQLVPIFQALNVENRTIMQAIAIIGPMQVLGRFLLTTRGNHFSTLRVGRWAMSALAGAMLILLLLPAHLLWLGMFAVLFGAGNGVTTILRGTAIAELFGRERYAELNGALSAPAVLAKAAAPLLLAALWSATGEPKIVFAGVLALVLVGVVGLVIATRAATAVANVEVDETAAT
jgi:MFS family permease